MPLRLEKSARPELQTAMRIQTQGYSLFEMDKPELRLHDALSAMCWLRLTQKVRVCNSIWSWYRKHILDD